MNRASWLCAALVAVLLPACAAGAGDERPTVVASMYPLAFAARWIGQPDVARVVDLTPPGSEAHDVELSLDDRALVEEADLVLYLGDVGFQPQIEGAVADAAGEVVAVGPPGVEEDPHFWLSPRAFAGAVEQILDGFRAMAPERAGAFEQRAAELTSELDRLDGQFRERLADCERTTMIVTHEAFGWMAGEYGFEQLGLAGVSPEGEPTAAALAEAQRAVNEGRATMVLYEFTPEGERIGKAVAADLGVDALPLATLESLAPTQRGDYLTSMRGSLNALTEALGCR